VTPYVRRTLWDGEQELAEIQVPADPQAPGLEEQDTDYPLQPYQPAAGPYGDPNPFYGRVVYGPGLRLAQPLSVTRYDYRDNPNGASSLTWPRFSWQVYWNYQGVPAYGTLTTGAYAYPYQLAAGQSSCPPLGSTTAQRCVIVQWPALHAAYDQNRGALRYQSWHGSVLEAKRDRSGLDDHRQRVYDPQSGRFTQEDPIGLAGGLNLYGFANSDPVNFSDPFGLCPKRVGGDGRTQAVTDCPQDVMNRWAAKHITITAHGGTDWAGVDPALRNAVVWASMDLDVSFGVSGGRESGHSSGGGHLQGSAVDINTVNGVRLGAMPLDIAANSGNMVARTITSFLPVDKQPIMIYTPGMAYRSTPPLRPLQRLRLLELHRTHIHITVP
jgi:RHS repeat-associated protein